MQSLEHSFSYPYLSFAYRARSRCRLLYLCLLFRVYSFLYVRPLSSPKIVVLVQLNDDDRRIDLDYARWFVQKRRHGMRDVFGSRCDDLPPVFFS